MFGHGGSEAAALAACNVLGLRPEIERLSRKLDTMVGHGDADGVSASLAHRIAIARAIALSPRVLLLDEPQSQLDPAADRLLIAGLAALKGKMTIIISTSRPSYLELADQAFVLNGRHLAPMAGFTEARRAGAA
jgi:ABC-type bacteriocin/lantibiotic exporter with double-glycine peptidase domain